MKTLLSPAVATNSRVIYNYMNILNKLSHLRRPITVASVLVLATYSTGVLSQENNLRFDAAKNFEQNSAPDKPAVFAGERGGINYADNALVGKVEVEVDKDGLPADGQSSSKITVRLKNISGQPMDGIVTVEVSGGRLQLPDAKTDELSVGRRDLDRVTPGTQIKVQGGVAEFNLQAPDASQDVRIRVTAGSVTAEGIVSFLPDVREMIAAGLIEGAIRLSKKDAAQFASARLDDGFETELRQFERQFNDGKGSAAARAAVFLKGKIKGETLLTLAYDSEKETRARLLRDIRPEEFYPVYGDASLKGFDARSSSKLYVRVDEKKNYVLYGDFTTDNHFSPESGGKISSIRLRDLGQYNRTMTGVKGHWENPGFAGGAFATRDSLKQVVEEYQANGTSGPFAVRNNSALENSEKVELIVRDRNQLGMVKTVTTLVRFTDYSFEPFSGRILFKSAIPSTTPSGDPVYVRITYEVDTGGESFWVGGVDGQAAVGDVAVIGGSLVSDQNPNAPYKLGSINAAVKLGDKTRLTGELAMSEATTYSLSGGATTTRYALPTGQAGESKNEASGKAGRVALEHKDENVEAKIFVSAAGSEFVNPAASVSQGRREAGANASVNVTEKIKLFGDVTKSEDHLTGAERGQAQLGAGLTVNDRFSVEFGVRRIKEDSPNGVISLPQGPSGITTPGGTPVGGFGGGVDPVNLTGNGSSVTTLAPISSTVSTGGFNHLEATTLRLGAKWKATDLFTLSGEVEGDVQGDDKRRFALGGNYQMAERTRLFGRYETQSGLGSVYSLTPGDKSSAFVFGVDNTYMAGGQLFSEYRLRDAINGREAQLANGLRNTFNVSEGLAYTASAEHLKILRGPSPEALALTGGVDYTADPLWKGSARLEWRRAFDTVATPGNDSWLSTVSLARKLDRDWTMLARNYLLYAQNKAAGNALQDRIQWGFAYRDTDTNKFNGLAKYEYKIERNDAQAYERKAHVLSSHGDYHPSRPWWWTGRAAAKRVEETGATNYSAYLGSGRVVYDVTENWDVGLMASLLYSPQGAARQYAAGAEIGYLMRQNLWLSLGYNFTGFSDKDLTASDYTNSGLFIRLRFKFDENLFRKDSAKTSAETTDR
jgi:hypothetical protein